MSGAIEMYIAGHQVARDSLVQGDILRDIHILGALCYQEILIATPSTGEAKPLSWSVPKEPIRGDALVLSHSCEIAVENGVKLTSVILAPLRDVSKATAPAKVQELVESNLIDQSGAHSSFLKYFYLDPHAQLVYAKGAVADFSKLFSVRKTSYDYLLSRKVLQLTDEVRFSMSLKLALYFHRAAKASAA